MYSSAYVWAKILGQLESELTAPVVSAWFDEAEVLEYTDTKLVLYTPTSFRKEIIIQRGTPLIKRAMKDLFDANIEVTVLAEDEIQQYKRRENSLEFLEFNPQFTFEKFVVGGGNAFAHAAAMSVANHYRNNNTYNPLFIYSPPGLGKTHLLYAIASKVHKNNPEAKIVYISAEQFTNDLIIAIRNGEQVKFRNKYRSADLLLIDDIQFIAGRDSTQEEYFHTFNELYESGRQIVMAADRPPRDMAHLEERLRTRFEWGVITEITPPDYENRMAILNCKAQFMGVDLPENVADFIAQNIKTDVRKLEGSLNMLAAASSLNRSPITLEMAQHVLKDIKQNAGMKKPKPDLVISEVCRFYSFDVPFLKSNQRTKAVSEARQVAMYLLQELCDCSTMDIGRLLNRDHTTVMSGCKKIRAQINDPNTGIKDNIRDIRISIQNKV